MGPDDLGDWCRRHDIRVATAESLTGGQLAARFAAMTDAAAWFRGGVVAYDADVKFDLLGVPRGPVVTHVAADAMARGVRTLLGATVALAVTGVGGPGPAEGQPPGTVWGAIATDEGSSTIRWRFGGDPGAVLQQTCDAAVAWLAASCA